MVRREVLDEPLDFILENNPSPPDRMRDATVIFLAKHYFNMFEHRRPGGGVRLLLRSLRHAPLRNPASAVLLPLGALDAMSGTGLARRLLVWRHAARGQHTA